MMTQQWKRGKRRLMEKEKSVDGSALRSFEVDWWGYKPAKDWKHLVQFSPTSERTLLPGKIPGFARLSFW